MFRSTFRQLAALYETVIDAAEGAIAGVVVFVFIVWTWPYAPPDFAAGTEQRDWIYTFAGFGAMLGAVRSRWARKRRRAQEEDEEET